MEIRSTRLFSSMVTPQAAGPSSGGGPVLWLKKSWVNTIRAFTISLLVALEDDRSVSEPLLSSFFRETLENFAAIQNRRRQSRWSAKLFAFHFQSVRGGN